MPKMCFEGRKNSEKTTWLKMVPMIFLLTTPLARGDLNRSISRMMMVVWWRSNDEIFKEKLFTILVRIGGAVLDVLWSEQSIILPLPWLSNCCSICLGWPTKCCVIIVIITIVIGIMMIIIITIMTALQRMSTMHGGDWLNSLQLFSQLGFWNLIWEKLFHRGIRKIQNKAGIGGDKGL